MPRIDFINRVVQRKTGIEKWEWFRAENIDGNFLVHGGVPTLDKNGNRKWDRKAADKHIIGGTEFEAEKIFYEQETGHCRDCCGNGTVVAGWPKDTGTRYKPCKRCGGTGEAKHEDNR
jgi:hypothetical protein